MKPNFNQTVISNFRRLSFNEENLEENAASLVIWQRIQLFVLYYTIVTKCELWCASRSLIEIQHCGRKHAIWLVSGMNQLQMLYIHNEIHSLHSIRSIDMTAAVVNVCLMNVGCLPFFTAFLYINLLFVRYLFVGFHCMFWNTKSGTKRAR